MQGFRRFIAAVACVIVGGASFALSFVALRDVSVNLQAVPAGLGWLVPIVIDGGVICGSAIIWSLSHEVNRRPIFPFLFVASLVLVSVVVNASHAGPSYLAKLIASLPPLILLGTLELVAAQGRRRTPTAANEGINASPQPSMENALARPEPVTIVSTATTTATALTASPGARTAPQNTKVTDFTATHDGVTVPPAVPVDAALDAEIEAAVEEVFTPAPMWAMQQNDTPQRPNVAFSREANTPGSTSTRRQPRVRAEGPNA